MSNVSFPFLCDTGFLSVSAAYLTHFFPFVTQVDLLSCDNNTPPSGLDDNK